MSEKHCYVGSEVGQLRRVLLGFPRSSLGMITSSNAGELLFDEALEINEAEKEHKRFRKILQDHDVEVLLLKDLITDIISNEKAREWLLFHHCSCYTLGNVEIDKIASYLRQQTPDKMASHFFEGLAFADIGYNHHDSLACAMGGSSEMVLPALPNHLYTRDSSCWIYDGVLIGTMAKTVRKNEIINLRAVYNFHPIFTSKEFNFLHGNNDLDTRSSSIEGGDILVIGNGLVLIGVGERTTPQMVEILATTLFKNGTVKKVIVIELPKTRSYMHLDCIMTMLDIDCFSIYPPIIDNARYWELSPAKSNRVKVKQIKRGLFDYLGGELGTGKIRLVPTGGNSSQMKREQINNANNVLAIRPGLVVGYSCNVQTIDNMNDAGIDVLTISGAELGSGGGGAHCMSCPIERDGL